MDCALADSIAVQQDPARRDSLQLLLEEVNLEIRLVEQTFLQSGAVAQEEDREVVGASQSYTFAKNAPASRLKLALEQRVVTPSFRVAPVGRFAMDHTLPEGIVYQIEAFSSPRHATLEDIKGLMPVYEKLSTQLQYTYSVGIYTHYWEALLDLNRVRLQGFPRARIVAYRDGRRIPLSEARNEEL